MRRPASVMCLATSWTRGQVFLNTGAAHRSEPVAHQRRELRPNLPTPWAQLSTTGFDAQVGVQVGAAERLPGSPCEHGDGAWRRSRSLGDVAIRRVHRPRSATTPGAIWAPGTRTPYEGLPPRRRSRTDRVARRTRARRAVHPPPDAAQVASSHAIALSCEHCSSGTGRTDRQNTSPTPVRTAPRRTLQHGSTSSASQRLLTIERARRPARST